MGEKAGTSESEASLFPSMEDRNRPIQRAEAEEAINSLFRRALTEGDPKAWMRGLLKLIAQMSRYSVFNAKLIFLQRPGAVAVGTEFYWKRKHRTIRPGAMPIVILAPSGPIAILYEYEDTEGSQQLSLLDDEDHRGDKAISEAFYRSFASRVEAVGLTKKHPDGLIRVVDEGLGTARKGDVHHRRDRRDRYVIRINRIASPRERVLTLIHELGHIMCGHLGMHPLGWWPDRKSLGGLPEGMRHDIKEFEAEAVAWIIANRAGIASTAPDYLASKVAPLDNERLNINCVLDAANRIEPLLEKRR
ncbi:ImmA/IrrE family metallo-endopeptidase [Mesorhizobium sp. KR9-304]|uniref:ImmA/IrrE family metallo-endopeptidase n=1 Tax=Mesorhizobium sp. KR9-304 TaxID=3156614 RepID=UPI0032B352DF